MLLVLWFLVTNLGWVKPLFLPSPQAVFRQFYEYLTGQANVEVDFTARHLAGNALTAFAAAATPLWTNARKTAAIGGATPLSSLYRNRRMLTGFIGGEVASSISGIVGSVTVVEPAATPLERVLGLPKLR